MSRRLLIVFERGRRIIRGRAAQAAPAASARKIAVRLPERDGARAARLPTPGTLPAADEDPDAADASARGTAHELVLALYGRIPLDSLKLDGDRRLFDQLVEWDPDE